LGTWAFGILDFSVMKYCSEVKILAQQEYGHAELHNDAKKKINKEGDQVRRYWFHFKLFDFLFLRCGKFIGIPLALSIETCFGLIILLVDKIPFMSGFMTDLVLFHVYEEMEHSSVTVTNLRSKCSFISRILTFPIVFLLYSHFS